MPYAAPLEDACRPPDIIAAVRAMVTRNPVVGRYAQEWLRQALSAELPEGANRSVRKGRGAVVTETPPPSSSQVGQMGKGVNRPLFPSSPHCPKEQWRREAFSGWVSQSRPASGDSAEPCNGAAVVVLVTGTRLVPSATNRVPSHSLPAAGEEPAEAGEKAAFRRCRSARRSGRRPGRDGGSRRLPCPAPGGCTGCAARTGRRRRWPFLDLEAALAASGALDGVGRHGLAAEQTAF